LKPLDLPLPDYEVPVPLKDGYLHFSAALKQIDDAGRRGESVLLRLPEGEGRVPPSAWNYDPQWSFGWQGRTSEATQIVIEGAHNGTSKVLGGPGTREIFTFPSYVVGMVRLRRFYFQEVQGRGALSFGTGPYNKLKNVMVLENLVGRYVPGNFIMAACEQATLRDDGTMNIINDELWMSDIDFRYSAYEHCVYIDQRAYTYGRRLTMQGGVMHAFKCTALEVDLEDCVFSNVDPDTLKVHSVAPGEVSIYPNGKTFYSQGSNMSLIELQRGHYKNVKTIKVWPEGVGDAGAYAAGRQARQGLRIVNPELANPTSRDFWLAVHAAGIDNPDNPYLRPYRSLWEGCTFENYMPSGKTTKMYVVGKQSSYPVDSVGGVLIPAQPHHPDLYVERSRDFFRDCHVSGYEDYFRNEISWVFDPIKFPVEAEIVRRDIPRMVHVLDTKPEWWATSESEPDTTPPSAPVLIGEPAVWGA
jgi:hypothetical protein